MTETLPPPPIHPDDLVFGSSGMDPEEWNREIDRARVINRMYVIEVAPRLWDLLLAYATILEPDLLSQIKHLKANATSSNRRYRGPGPDLQFTCKIEIYEHAYQRLRAFVDRTPELHHDFADLFYND